MIQPHTYNPRFFNQIKKAEKNHFWFHVRRKWIFDRINKYIRPPAGVLEVGCGTGNISNFLTQKGYQVIGCEFHAEAIHTAWPGFKIVQGDANNLPFEDNRFDIVGLFDVIEHFHDDIPPVKEAVRVVRDGGIVALTVPAREELWSYIDEVSLHKRRYTKETVKKIFRETNLNTLLIEYIFMSLYIPLKHIRGKRKNNEDDLFKINRFVNTVLTGLFSVERIISKGLTLPIGTSLIAIAQKKSA
jgi:SAM-dependent methyltransferase